MTPEQILYLSAFFLIYSFLGWIIDSSSRTLRNKKLINGGYLYGPFCPIYGVPAVFMIIFYGYLEVVSQKVDLMPLFFLGSIIVLTSWEYFIGWALEKIFNKKFWDYTGLKFQYKGRICLSSSIGWGILAVFFIVFIHPFVKGLVESIPIDILFRLLILCYTLLLGDFVISTFKHVKEKLELLKDKIIKSKA